MKLPLIVIRFLRWVLRAEKIEHDIRSRRLKEREALIKRMFKFTQKRG
jgi:hypothetical protein